MTKKHLFLPVIALFLCCAGQEARERFIRIFFPGGQEVIAELALTDEERQRGLMFREGIQEDQAMLFVFEEEGIHSFWMKNMRFPIDILWLDKEKRVVHIEPDVPPCPRDPCPSYASPRAAHYVLELQSGWAQRHGLHLYDRLEFILPREKN